MINGVEKTAQGKVGRCRPRGEQGAIFSFKMVKNVSGDMIVCYTVMIDVGELWVLKCVSIMGKGVTDKRKRIRFWRRRQKMFKVG